MVDFTLIIPAVVTFFVVILIFLLYPRLYFFFFIIFRPVFDYWSNVEIGGFNIAIIFTLLLILICSSDILIRKEKLIRIKNNKFLRGFNTLFITFLLFSALSFINTKDLVISVSDFLRLISMCIVVNYTVVNFSINEHEKKRFIIFVLLSSIIPLAVGLYQILTGSGFSVLLGYEKYNRIHATFIHPNVFAQYLVLITMLTLFVFDTWKFSKVKRVFVLSFLALVIFELYYTFGRGAWIATFGCYLIYVFLKRRLSKKIILLFFLCIFLLAGYTGIKQRFEDVLSPGVISRSKSSWDWRLETWDTTLRSFKKHFFIGNGLGMHELDYDYMAHNDYIRIYYEIGIFGIILYIWLLAFLAFFYLRKIQQAGKNNLNTNKATNEFTIALSISLGISVMSFASNMLRSTLIMIYYFSVCSIFNMSFKEDKHESSFYK